MLTWWVCVSVKSVIHITVYAQVKLRHDMRHEQSQPTAYLWACYHWPCGPWSLWDPY